MRLDTEIIIERPVSEVFSTWADRERSSEWAGPVEEVRKISDGPIDVGSEYLEVARLPGQRVESNVKITAFEPDHVIAATWSGGMEGNWEARFSEHADGTKLNVHAVMNQKGVLRLLEPIMGGFARKAMQRDLESFKAVVESEGS